jgi:hypothetical protein
LLERGQELEKASYHQFMASLVFTAFTLEAYLNWLGDKLFPHWSYLERLKPKEKLAVISDQLKVRVENSQRPWQTIKSLSDFKNSIAHGKPETIATESVEPIDVYLDQKLSKIDRTDWEEFCTPGNAERAREDVEQIIRKLHAAAGLDESVDPFFSGLRFHKAQYKPDSPGSPQGAT